MVVLQLRPAWEQLHIAPQAFEHTQQQLYPAEYIAEEHVGVYHSLNATALMKITSVYTTLLRTTEDCSIVVFLFDILLYIYISN